MIGKYVEYGNCSRSIISNHSTIVGPLTAAQALYILKNHARWASQIGDYFPFQRLVTPKEGDRVITSADWLACRSNSPSIQAEFSAL